MKLRAQLGNTGPRSGSIARHNRVDATFIYLRRLTEGRIGFSGKRSELQVGESQTLHDVQIDFSINRVTGELYLRLKGIAAPSGYKNTCVAKDKVL